MPGFAKWLVDVLLVQLLRCIVGLRGPCLAKAAIMDQGVLFYRWLDRCVYASISAILYSCAHEGMLEQLILESMWFVQFFGTGGETVHATLRN